MSEHRALWVSTSMRTRGGVATYVRDIRQTPLWTDWNVRHVATHRDGSATDKIAAFACGALKFLAELIRYRPSVIHIHSSADSSFVRKSILLWIGTLTQAHIVLHIHASGFPEFYDQAPRFAQKIIRATLSRANTVIALSEVQAKQLQLIAPNARIIAIPNAIVLHPQITHDTTGGPVRVVFLGRIGDHKGAFRLLDAWSALSHDPEFATEPAPATLTLAGDGEVELARQRIRELGLDSTVELFDWLPTEAVAELLDRSHVLVLPSRNEGQPMAVLEAMTRGLCVVASDVGGLAEMIGGGCGVVVPPDDVDAITDALRQVIYNPEVRVRCGAAAHSRIETHFDINVVWRRIEALYRELTRF
ncbi:glycosyltransferase family 4 protein [Mycobacterium sp. 155]|uniref:glycosyltransferase family 4 protein n=1 Tax=Mycobacterium sp. 155 TaxID=1157943 RepID=UPI0003A4EE5B|nr:glycosyltransferase family 4 protein [Mycobacterium sp. 155]